MRTSKLNSSPKVTVCLVTYNQEAYISECLESVVTQNTDFDFDIIVSDDCSSDKTREIIKQYAEIYPNIKTLFRKVNVGACENFIDTHDRATGQYVCHLDGDDYWLPGKLQKQADFLDANPDCNLLWTRFLYQKGEETVPGLVNDNDPFWNRRFYRGAIISHMAIGTNSSLMYRAKCRLEERPPFDVIDYFKNVEAVKNGYASFTSNEPLCVYRVGIGIASSGLNTVKLIYKSMSFFYKKYPENKSDLFCSALLVSYSCLKKKRARMFFSFFGLALKCLSPLAIKKLKSATKDYKKLTMPKFNSDFKR
jgi:glycosyltransferase involved in cell wall biosynthesis